MNVMRRRVKNSIVAVLAAGLAIGLSVPCWAQDSAKLFADNCAGCHGPNGKGDGPAAASLSPAPGDFAKTLAGKSDDWVAKIIKGGGAAVDMAPSMPPFGSMLNDDQIKAMAGYVKNLQK
jgi:mono/diheme cytochrome c family protein